MTTSLGRPDDSLIAMHAAEIRASVERAEQGHRIYHAATANAGAVIAKLRALSPPVEWRDIDLLTGVAPSTAVRWMRLAAGEAGPYVRAGRNAPDDSSADAPTD